MTYSLAPYYKGDIKVSIDVEYRSQYYYVFGQATAPGPKRYTGRDTLTYALADAAITHLAWPQRIHVIHPSHDPLQRHVTVINMYDIIQRGDNSQNVLLAQDDIVFIPLNPLAAIGVAVENLLFPVQPIVNAAAGARGLTGGF